MTRRVTVVDYGVGNLLSVARAFEHCGAAVDVTSDPGKIASAGKLVLPGVGAFGDAMDELRRRELIDPVLNFIRTGAPFLGLCVGMQIMLEVGEEFGLHDGLGIIPGRVVAIPRVGAANQPHKIPHIGWKEIKRPEHASWNGTILEGLPENPSVYFVHSFRAELTDRINCLAEADYDGLSIPAVVASGSIVGCQFHPEKSGANGLRILDNFLGGSGGGNGA